MKKWQGIPGWIMVKVDKVENVEGNQSSVLGVIQ